MQDYGIVRIPTGYKQWHHIIPSDLRLHAQSAIHNEVELLLEDFRVCEVFFQYPDLSATHSCEDHPYIILWCEWQLLRT